MAAGQGPGGLVRVARSAAQGLAAALRAAALRTPGVLRRTGAAVAGRRLGPPRATSLPAELLRRVEEVEGAHREWLFAQRYFDCVTEPELVDEAVHRILAAERRYLYLLRRAREDGVPEKAALALLPRAPAS